MQKALQIEQDLLIAISNGDRSAAESVYLQHYPTVTKWIIKHGGDEHDASDIFQEAMVILYQKAQEEKFRLSCKIGTYLFAIAKNLWYKKLQKDRRGGTISTEVDTEDLGMAYEDDVKVHAERELYYEQLDKALNQLGEPCSSILKAFYYKGKTMNDIAEDFGYTNPDNAKNQKYKCLTRLKKLFYNDRG